MSSIFRSTLQNLLGCGLALALAPAAWAQGRTFVLTPASEIRYAGHHPAHDWVGVSHALKGQLVLGDNEQPSLPVEVSVPVRSFNSGNRNRDANALAAIEADRFPDTSLTVRQLELSNRKSDGKATTGQVRVSGTLSFHGVERPLNLTLDGRLEGDHLKASGTFPLQLSEFHVKRPALLFVPIDDTIVVTVVLDAVSR